MEPATVRISLAISRTSLAGADRIILGLQLLDLGQHFRVGRGDRFIDFVVNGIRTLSSLKFLSAFERFLGPIRQLAWDDGGKDRSFELSQHGFECSR